MRKIKTVIIFTMYFIFCCFPEMKAQTSFSFNHGPYLMGLTTTGVTVFFTTNEKALSWVEVKNKRTEEVTVNFDTVHGLKQANNHRNRIRIEKLASGSEYSYRLCSKEIIKFEPYKKEFGDSIYSDWFTFRTLPLKKETGTYLVVCDIHDHVDRMENLLRLADYENCDMIFMNGDMMNDRATEEQPYMLLDKATEMFAKESSFVFVRGNHEYRGSVARNLTDYLDTVNGRFYYTYTIGNTLFIIMDSTEEGDDATPSYAGCTDIDNYRAEQTEWLKKVVKSEEFKNAKNRIVFAHIPPIGANSQCSAVLESCKNWVPIWNEAGIDLLISGHNHHFSHVPIEPGINNFPILINGNKTITRLTINKKEIGYQTIDEKGDIILNELIQK